MLLRKSQRKANAFMLPHCVYQYCKFRRQKPLHVRGPGKFKPMLFKD